MEKDKLKEMQNTTVKVWLLQNRDVVSWVCLGAILKLVLCGAPSTWTGSNFVVTFSH